MTKEEAQKELAEIEPKEAAAWKAYTEREEARNKEYMIALAALNKIYPDAKPDLDRLNDQWSPLYRRKQQLKTFLEIA